MFRRTIFATRGFGRLVVLAVLVVTSLPAFAREDASIEQLVARAESAHQEDRPPLYAEAARRELEAADKAYTAGNIEEATAALHDVVDYSDRARDAAVQTNKKLKDTEIAMRKMAHRLRDLKPTLAMEDQTPVQAAIDHLEEIRTQLLERIFKKKGS